MKTHGAGRLPTGLDEIKKFIAAHPAIAETIDPATLSESEIQDLLVRFRNQGEQLGELRGGEPSATKQSGSVDHVPLVVAKGFVCNGKTTQTAAVQKSSARVDDSIGISGPCGESVRSPRRLSVEGRFLDGAEVIISNPRVKDADGRPKVLFRGRVESKPTSPHAPREDDGWTDGHFRIPPDADWFGDDPLLVQQKMGDEQASEPALVRPKGHFSRVRPRFIDTACIDPRALYRSGQIKAGPGAALPHSTLHLEFNGAQIAEIDVGADGSFEMNLPRYIQPENGPIELFAPGRDTNRATALLNPTKSGVGSDAHVFGWQRELREALTQTPNAKGELSFSLSGLPSGWSMTITRQGGGSERFTADDAGNLHVRMCDVQVGYALSVRGDAFTHRGVLRTPAFSTRPAPAKESARLNALSEEFPNAGEVELGTIHQLFGVHGALADTAISDAREAYFGYGLARVIRQKFPLEDFAATIREHLSAPGASRARLEGFEAGFVTGDLRVWQSHTAEDVGLRLIEAGASRRVVAGGTDVLRPENSTRLFPETRVASSEYALVLPDMKPLTLRTKPQTFPG